MSLFCRWFFKHVARKNQQPGLFKWNIGWKWVNVCLEMPFTKNVDCLETSQLFCIANHLIGFCTILVLAKSCFLTKYCNFVNVPKSVSGIDLFRCECKFKIFFFLLKCHVWNTPFSFTVVQKVSLNDSLGLKLFMFFLGILKIYSQINYLKDYLFLIEIWTERALFQKAVFLHVTSRTVWNCFLTCNYLPQIITCIRHIKPLSLSFITSTSISSSSPFTKKLTFYPSSVTSRTFGMAQLKNCFTLHQTWWDNI